MRHDLPAGGRDARDSCVGPESGSLAPDAIDPIGVCALRRRARPPHESGSGPAPYEKEAGYAKARECPAGLTGPGGSHAPLRRSEPDRVSQLRPKPCEVNTGTLASARAACRPTYLRVQSGRAPPIIASPANRREATTKIALRRPPGAQPTRQRVCASSGRCAVSTATPRPPIVASAPLGAQPSRSPRRSTLQESAPFYGADSWSRPAVSGSTRYSISRSRSSSSRLGGGGGGGSSGSICTPR